MDSINQLRNDASILKDLLTVYQTHCAVRLEKLSTELKAASSASKTSASALEIAGIPPVFQKNSIVIRLWRYIRRSEIIRLGALAAESESVRLSVLKRGRDVERSRRSASTAANRLVSAVASFDDLDHPPSEIMELLSKISGRVSNLRNAAPTPDCVKTSSDLINIVAMWADASRRARGESDRAGGGRIWLPIPYSMARLATSLGASQERGVKGASRFFVNVGDPLAKFNALLPHAFRETKPDLRFASIRKTAQRQNLWSFLDAVSWDHIRNVNYAMTGRRCALCGKQSGSLLRVIDPSSIRKEGSVECHEVWNWSRPDPSLPVGIQSLERILVVCFDCHMCFHDEIARGKALKTGGEDLERRVQGYLIKRRSFLTGDSPKDVVLDMKAERLSLKAHADVDTWIVDLSKLSKQDYMFGQVPTLLSGNPAGVKPSQLAGIAFKDQSGRLHPAVNPERLYQETAAKRIPQPEPGFRILGR